MAGTEHTEAVDPSKVQASGEVEPRPIPKPVPNTQGTTSVPPEEYRPADQAVRNEAAKGFDGFACVLDHAEWEKEYRLMFRSGPEADAKKSALALAKDWHRESSCFDPSRSHIRVFRIQGGKVRRIAYFLVGYDYREEDFEHEHVDSARTCVFSSGPDKPHCEIRIDPSPGPGPLLYLYQGQLSNTALFGRFVLSVHATVELVPPGSWNLPMCRFSGRVTFSQIIAAYGSHPDPRYRIVRYLYEPNPSGWSDSRSFVNGPLRRSLYREIREHWPTFADKAFASSLKPKFQKAILERLYRKTYNRQIGVYAPTLRRGQLDLIKCDRWPVIGVTSFDPSDVDWRDPLISSAGGNGTTLRFHSHAREILDIDKGSKLAFEYDSDSNALKLWPAPQQNRHEYECVLNANYSVSIGRFLVRHYGIRLVPSERYRVEKNEHGNDPPYFISMRGKTLPA